MLGDNRISLEPQDDSDPRASQPCPLGHKNEGQEHDVKVADDIGYLWQCACGAWQKGYFVNLGERGKYLVSAAQLQSLIDAGLHVPQELRDDVKRRLTGKS